MNNSSGRYRRICFTLNNYTLEEEQAIQTIDCSWMIYGHEIGTEGTKHLQGAIILGKQYSLGQVKKLPGISRAHIETMRGSPAQNRDYCTKQDKDTFFEKGSMPKQGKRSDLQMAVAQIQGGSTLAQLASEIEGATVVVKYYKGLSTLRSLLAPNRTEAPIVLWLHGTTGSGKTRSAVQLGELAYSGQYWISNGSLQWFDGYDGQPMVIFDDLRSNHAKFSFLLRLLDRYRLAVPIKGGFVNFAPQIILITSPYSPSEMWNLRSEEDINQLTRRCTKIIKYTNEISYGPLDLLANLDDQQSISQTSTEPTIIPDTPERESENSRKRRDKKEKKNKQAKKRRVIDLTCDEDLFEYSLRKENDK